MSEHLILGTFYNDMEYLYKMRYDYYGVDENDEIIMFCNRAKISPSILKNRSRKVEVIRYRRAFVNFSKKTHVHLARILNMHHSSIIHLRKTHKEYLEFDYSYTQIWNLVDK